MMMTTDLMETANQTARHYLDDLAPPPEPLVLHPYYTSIAPYGRLAPAFLNLRQWVREVYAAGVTAPADLIPRGTARRPEGPPRELSESDMAVYPRLLFGLGVLGCVDDGGGQGILRVEREELAEFCAAARIRDWRPYLAALEPFGLFSLPSSPLQFRCPAYPDLTLALALFARACRALADCDTHPPRAFLRLDLRVLERCPRPE